MQSSTSALNDLPVLYFFSDLRMPHSEDGIGLLVSFNEKAGPVQGETGIPGLRLDFNAGCRLRVPEGNFHVRISNNDTEQIFYDMDIQNTILISMEQYFIPWKIEVWLDKQLVFVHEYDATGQRVCCELLGNVPGDSIPLLPSILAFQKKWHCEIELLCGNVFADILKNYYPSFHWVTEFPKDTYASYHVGACQDELCFQPDSSRSTPALDIGRNLLGLLHPAPLVPYTPTKPRQIPEPYVCIAVQASGARKCWLYPGGWDVAVAYLKELGYRVLCIDGEFSQDEDGYHIEKPAGAEDYTGMHPLMERINLLAYASFFIGVSSGLSWLAHASQCPQIVISGITLPYTELTDYRVINRQVCHGCFNDMRVNWRTPACPHHHDTDRMFECSRKITPKMVIHMIDCVRAEHPDR